MEIIWGQYFGYFKRENLVNINRNTSDELYLTRNYRILFINYYDADSFDNINKIKVGLFKELIGNDKIYPTHGRPFEYMPKILFHSSVIPDSFERDGGIRRKMKIVDFKTTFKSVIPNDDVDSGQIFQADPNFIKKLDSLAPAALWVLVQKFKEYQLNRFDHKPIKSLRKQ